MQGSKKQGMDLSKKAKSEPSDKVQADTALELSLYRSQVHQNKPNSFAQS